MRFLTRTLFPLLLLVGFPCMCAGQIDPTKPPPPPPAETSSSKPSSSSTPPDSPPHEAQKAKPIDPSTPPLPPPAEDASATTAPAPSGPVFDPYHAQKSLDVGTFYLKAGKYDAAIDRFQEAAHYQPSLAAPWKLLGETYEKQRAYGMAAESYKKYLDVFPGAPDAAKITKEIQALEEKTGKDSSKDAAH